MIPILYKENETNFNSNGIGHLNETINYEVREERNGAFELEMEYPVSGRWFKELKDFRLILAKPNDTDEDHLFRIYEMIKNLSSQTVTIYATTRSNDLGGNLVKGVTVTNETPQVALNKMKANLIQPTDYKFVSDIQTKSSTEWIRRNPLNCIAGEEGSLVNYWGGEIKRTNDTVYLYSRRGKDKVTLIRQGKNLEGFELTSSTKGMITRILPFFTYIPDGKDDEVTITGTIVDSPLVNNYPVKYITPVDYSFDDTIDTLAKLNAAAKSYFEYQNPGCDKPAVNMEIDLLQLSDSSEYEKFKDLEHIGLTDTVEVWVEKFDVDVEVKINELTYNGSLNQVTNIVAGSQPHNLYDDVKKDYKDDFSYLEKYINSMENGIRNTIQIAADGKSTIFRGYTEPDINISKLNDLWFKELGSGEVEVYIFDGAYWQPYITAGLNEAVKAEVNAILAQSEIDRVKAEEDIEQAIAKAESDTLQQSKEFDDKLVIVNQEITSVKKSADEAVAKSEQAIKDAGFAQLDASGAKTNAANALSAANNAKLDASSALTKANTAITDSSKALTKANTAITDSSKALTNANSALTRVGAVEVTTGSLTTSYDALTKTVALKADQTTVDGINGKVTTQGTAITANATAIALKADKTLVDTINGTVSKHTTDIKATADGLLLKADSSVVNTIKGTVDTHTTQIKATSDGLALKADKSVVDTINGTVSKHTTDIKANSDGLKLKADSSVVNTLSGTVTTHTTQIKAASDGLALKADSSLVNTIKGTVDTHTTQIKANSDGLKLKADSSTVNTISGTVTTHTNQIAANSQAITARLTSAQVETILTGKKYVNETTLSATSKGLTAQITQVSTDLSNLEIGGTNLLISGSSYNTKDERSISNSGTKENYINYSESKISLQPSTTYTLSVEFSATSNVQSVDFFFVSDTAQHKSLSAIANTNGIFVYKAWTFKTGDNTNQSGYIRFDLNGSSGGVAVLKTKKVKLEKGNKATDWSPAPEDLATVERVVTIEANINGIQTTVAAKADKTQITQLSNQISSKVESSTYNSKMTQLDSSINARVEKNNIITQINLSAETSTVLIQGKRIQLDGNVAMNAAFITRLDTQTLSAVTANIASIRTKILTTDVILSTMIKSDTALVTKIFATDANVSILTAKTAFINSVKAIDISADRVTAGTLNAAKVTIINLDASRIVSGSLIGINIKSASNGSTFEVQGNNLKMTKANGDNLIMDTSGIYWKNSAGAVLFQTSNKMTTSDIFGTAEFNVYLAGFNESRSVTQDSALKGSGAIGDYKYIAHRADGFYGNFLENNTGNTGFHIYVRPDFGGELRVTKPGKTDDYQPVRAQIAYAHRVALNTYNTSSNHLYIGSPDEVRFSTSNENTNPNGTIRAGKVFASSIMMNDIDTGAYYLYLRNNGGVRVMGQGAGESTWKDISASNFHVSSSRDYKKGIEDLDLNATDLILSTPVRKYWFKEDDEIIDYKRLGLVVQEAPKEIINFRGGDTLDIYAMASLLWKAVQEQSKEITELKQIIEKLESAS